MEFFAYGSSMVKKRMKSLCPKAKPKYQAVLPNYKLIFTGWSREFKSSTATVCQARGERVLGAVWEISEIDLKKLDRYQGYPAAYDRMNVLVIKDDGSAEKVITYIKRNKTDTAQPSPEYLSVIKQGYKNWGII